MGLLLIGAITAAAYLKREEIRSLVEEVKNPAVQVRLLTVSLRPAGDPPPVLTATGRIVSDHRVEVATKVSGQIVALHFEQGDRVERGQLLARIEDVIYRARRDQAAAELTKARANLAFQKVNFERAERLYKQASAPEIEHADARRALEEAQAQVAAHQAALEWAQKAFDDCQVAAPIAGVILERNVEVGDFVAAEGGRGAMANAHFAVIADMTKLRVEVDISELDVARLHKSMSCMITPEAYRDRRYRGHVLWLDPGADYSKATVQAKVRIQEPDDYLRVEGSAQVTFLLEEPASDPATQPAGRPWIPLSACVMGTGGTARVFVATGQQVRERQIKLGRQAGGQVEVIEGLQEGQRIVATDLASLQDGTRIK